MTTKEIEIQLALGSLFEEKEDEIPSVKREDIVLTHVTLTRGNIKTSYWKFPENLIHPLHFTCREQAIKSLIKQLEETNKNGR